MIDQTARVAGIVKEELKKVAMGAPVGFAVGQVFAPVPAQGQPGQIGLGPAWMVTVTLKNPLLGYTDIAESVPIPGVMPPEEAFRIVVARLFEECMKEHDKALTMEQAA